MIASATTVRLDLIRDAAGALRAGEILFAVTRGEGTETYGRRLSTAARGRGWASTRLYPPPPQLQANGIPARVR